MNVDYWNCCGDCSCECVELAHQDLLTNLAVTTATLYLGSTLAAAADTDVVEPLSPLLQGTVGGVLAVMCITILMALLRLMRGPDVPDRVVALDLIGTNIVGMTSVLAIASDEPTFLSVGMVLALIAFLGTVAFAHYVRKGGQP